MLQAYPVRDHAFARDVHEVVEHVTAEALLEDAAVGDLETAVQARLRTRYPNAIVHAQDPFARLRDPDVMLYAYRDGRIRVEDPGRERLYRALAAARTTYSESRRLVRESEAVGSSWASTHRDRDADEDLGDDWADVSPSRPLSHQEGSAPPDR